MTPEEFRRYWKENFEFDDRRVRVLIGMNGNRNREGNIIHGRSDEKVCRIAFDEFWSRSDGQSGEEANDNGWYFPGEWEYV